MNIPSSIFSSVYLNTTIVIKPSTNHLQLIYQHNHISSFPSPFRPPGSSDGCCPEERSTASFNKRFSINQSSYPRGHSSGRFYAHDHFDRQVCVWAQHTVSAGLWPTWRWTASAPVCLPSSHRQKKKLKQKRENKLNSPST